MPFDMGQYIKANKEEMIESVGNTIKAHLRSLKYKYKYKYDNHVCSLCSNAEKVRKTAMRCYDGNLCHYCLWVYFENVECIESEVSYFNNHKSIARLKRWKKLIEKM